MRTGILVGACGLALAGVAEAQRSSTAADGAQAKTDAKPVIRNDFTARRDAVVGAPGSKRRAELEDDIRQQLREGRIDPRRVTFTGVIDEVIQGVGMELNSRDSSRFGSPDPRTSTRADAGDIAQNPNPWAGTLDADDFLEAFRIKDNGGVYDPHILLDPAIDPVTNDPNRIPLAGQTAPNGNTWGAAADFVGIVDNNIAQTGANWDPNGSGFSRHGVAGGPDPNGDRVDFFANPRGSLSEQPERTAGGFFDGRLSHQVFAPTADTPVATVADLYLDDITTFVWWRPVSFTEGFIVTNVFLGGFDFQYFAPFVNAQNIADRLIILGPKPGSPNQGEFFGAADGHLIQTQEWINVALRQASDSFSVWVRDSSTTSMGFEQDGPFDAFPGDPNAGAFAGEIFSSGWLQFFPGVEDDTTTLNVTEGIGPAFNLFNQKATQFSDATGSPAGPVLFSFAVDALQIISGSDPGQDIIPGFEPHDYYYDNHTVIGEPFPLPDPTPDMELPFFDDIELWNAGPLGLQGDVWFDNSNAEVVDNRSAGTGAQSVRQTGIDTDGDFRLEFDRDVPIAVADTVEPVVFQAMVRRSDTAMSRAIFLDDNTQANDFMVRFIMGGRNENLIVDNRVYVRLPNPDFDETQPQDEVTGINEIHDPTKNREFINVPLEDAGGSPIGTPTGTFFPVRFETIATSPTEGSVRVFVNGVEGFLDETGLGLTTPIGSITTPSLGVDDMEIWSGRERNGLLNQVWIDEISLDGPRILDADTLTVNNPPFDDDPAFTLPYDDGFETYDADKTLNQQGATPFLESLFTDVSQLDSIPVANAPVAGTTTGFEYMVDTVLLGTVPGGAVAGETVFIEDNIPPTLTPDPAPVPGSVAGATTRFKFRDNNRNLVGEADLILSSGADPVLWDGTTPVAGRFLAVHDERWATVIGEDLLESADPTSSGRGQVETFFNTFTSGDSDTGDLDGILGSQLPVARTDGGSTVTLAFDLWITKDVDANGPRGRFAWNINGPGAQPGSIAQVVFGGPNNFIDAKTFNPVTGAVSDGADGLPDNFFRGQPEAPGGPATFADPTKLYVRVPNPQAGFGNPISILEQTSFTVPTNTWLRCTAEISGAGNYTITIDDGSAPFVVSGSAFDLDGDVSGTDSLNLSAGWDDGADGEAATSPILIGTLGSSAAPEGGTAPLSEPATPVGSFNVLENATYFYFEVFEIFAAPDGTLPQISDVDPETGAVVETRDIRNEDVIVLWNNKQTAGTGGADEVFTSVLPRNGRFQITNDGGTTIDVRGEWTPLGLPGSAGLNDPAPRGGIIGSAPPYSDFPFLDILMGTIVDFPAIAEPSVPPAGWNIDNVHLAVSDPCPGNLVSSTPEAVDGADLGSLLSAWGSNSPNADLNNDGVVDGADLGSLLSAWGPCP